MYFRQKLQKDIKLLLTSNKFTNFKPINSNLEFHKAVISTRLNYLNKPDTELFEELLQYLCKNSNVSVEMLLSYIYFDEKFKYLSYLPFQYTDIKLDEEPNLSLLHLLETEYYSDFELKLYSSNSGELIKTYKVHKIILWSRVEYFYHCFKPEYCEHNEASINLDNSIFSEEALPIILKYIYSSEFDTHKDYSLSDWIRLWKGLDYWQLIEFKNHLEIYSIPNTFHKQFKCLCKKCQTNIFLLLKFSFRNNIKELVQSSINYFMRNKDLIISREFMDLNSSIIELAFEELNNSLITKDILNQSLQLFFMIQKVQNRSISMSWVQSLIGKLTPVYNNSLQMIYDLILESSYNSNLDQTLISGQLLNNWNKDFLEEILNFVIDNLKEDKAILFYQFTKQLQFNRIDEPMIEDKLNLIIRYIRINSFKINRAGGFNRLSPDEKEQILNQINIKEEELSLNKNGRKVIIEERPKLPTDQQLILPRRPLQVNQRVYILKPFRSGIIRYLGKLHFTEGDWVGLELIEGQGKGDGLLQGRRYFSTEPERATFVKREKVLVTG